MGSCVDNSRIFVAVSQWAQDLKVDMCDLPVAAAAMEWMSEKAMSIASCAIGMGALTVLGTVPQFLGSEEVYKLYCEEAAKMFGGNFVIESDPDKAAKIIIDHVEAKREKIGLKS
jgi:carbon-monoxide dehydrogenase catalytic subunit